MQGRAAPRRRPARPRLTSGGPARHHRRRLLFASQQTIIHTQRSAGRQAVSGQRNCSACMFDGWIPVACSVRLCLCALDSRFACEINTTDLCCSLHCSYIQRWSTLRDATELRYVAFYFLSKKYVMELRYVLFDYYIERHRKYRATPNEIAFSLIRCGSRLVNVTE